VPVEDVVSVLRKLHLVLVPDGLLLDTQPVSRHADVKASSGRLGALDMSEWRLTIDRVSRRVRQTIREGLFTLVRREYFTVTDQFDNGAEVLDEAPSWAGVRLDSALAGRLARERGEVQIDQTVRLQVLQPQIRLDQMNTPTV
jgi:hypothetical protein